MGKQSDNIVDIFSMDAPFAITMWDFSWIERRWPGAGYEDWILELNAIGIKAAASTGRWAGMATSNFCGPQFHGMWREKEWHQKMTDIIRQSGK